MHTLKNNSTVIGILVVLLLAAAYVTYSISQQNKLREDGSAASSALNASQATPYTDLQGEPFNFEQFKGQVRVVNSWASWCPFCVEELKDFEKLADSYKEQNVVVLAINRKETKEKALRFLETVGTFDSMLFAVDVTDAFYKSIGGFSMPETIFYDAQGNVVVHKRGFMDYEEMRLHTEKALNSQTK